MKKTIRLNERELNDLICEAVRKQINNPQQTDIETVILAKNFANLIYQLNMNYDLQLNYGDDLNEYSDRIADMCQGNDTLRQAVNKFNMASRELLLALGDDCDENNGL